MRPEQVPARHVEITLINEPAILPEEFVAVGAVSPVVLVPGHRRLVVVHRMEVVEEEQGSENPGTLDDRRPLAAPGLARCSPNERIKSRAIPGTIIVRT